jgi:hypothetical protein
VFEAILPDGTEVKTDIPEGVQNETNKIKIHHLYQNWSLFTHYSQNAPTFGRGTSLSFREM